MRENWASLIDLQKIIDVKDVNRMKADNGDSVGNAAGERIIQIIVISSSNAFSFP